MGGKLAAVVLHLFRLEAPLLKFCDLNNTPPQQLGIYYSTYLLAEGPDSVVRGEPEPALTCFSPHTSLTSSHSLLGLPPALR